ncbi:MAG: peptide chain release factor N(5)-glutamine methyltransferase [Pseudomonadota bacterium]
MSITAWRRSLADALTSSGAAAQREANWLLRTALDLSHAELLARADEVPNPALQEVLGHFRAAAADGMPLAYIVGTEPFMDFELAVTPATLIPRADTEVLVEQALARLGTPAQGPIADLGTGSGAVAIALARQRPDATVVATDVSRDALAVARKNAERLSAHTIQWRVGDWFDALPQEQRFAVIASNPPYVESTFPELHGALRHEPMSALAAGPDGLDALKRIARDAADWLLPGGWLVLEHGHEQGEAVSGILSARAFRHIKTYHDRGGRPRVTEAQTPLSQT